MINRELKYNEGICPVMSQNENLDFRRWQLYVHKTIYELMQQGFMRDNFLMKLRQFVNFVNAKTNGFYRCTFMETADYIRVELYHFKHIASKAVFEIRYDE